jgi:sulfite exporter TauE/SafE
MPACCAIPESDVAVAATVVPEYLLLLTVGGMLVVGHCAGMCGPLMIAFRFGLHEQFRSRRVLAAGGQVLAYQTGRVVPYAAAGAAAGLAGAWLATWLERWSPLITLLLAVGLLAVGLIKLGLLGRFRLPAGGSDWVVRWGRQVQGWKRHCGPYLGAGLIGAALSVMPCMLTFWTLALAAQTGSWLHGAALMALLVVMTTPVLVACAAVPAWWGGWRRTLGTGWAGRLPAILLLVTALWLLLRVAASWGWIPHASFAIGGDADGQGAIQVVFW